MNEKRRLAIVCFATGLFIAPVALILAFFSAGAGHGSYVFARLLFPYSMLLTLTTDNLIANPLIILGVIQFPIYGIVTAVASLLGRAVLIVSLIVIGTVHLVAAAACFSGNLPNFS